MKNKLKLCLLLVISMISAQWTYGQSVTITPVSATICAGLGTPVALQANPVGGIVISYLWAPNGETSSTITVSPAVTTTYTVTATFVGGTTPSALATVTVNPNPTPTVTSVPVVPTVCAGNVVTLTSSVATTYQWYVNGGVIPGATGQSYAASASGSYQVNVVVGSCSGMSVATGVTVNPLPVANVTPVGPLATCWGTPIILGAQAGIGYSYQWQNSPNGLAPWNNVVGQTNPTITISVTSYYRVAVTDGNGCINYSN